MDEQKNSAQQQNKATPEISPSTPSSIDPPDPPPNPPSENSDYPKKMSTSDKVMVWATCVIAAGTLVSAAAIFEQWREMVKGGTDTNALVGYAQRQADATDKIKLSADNQARAAAGFAKSAEAMNTEIGVAEGDFARMAKNSEGAIKATQESMRQDQRAWVGLMQFTGIPEVGKPYEINGVFQNTGKTPAMRFTHQARATALPKGTAFAPNYGSKLEGIQSFSTLFPNQAFHDVIKTNGKDLLQSDLDDLNRGDFVVYVFGRACYEDVFGKHHWQRFCEYYDPVGKDYPSCDRYNEIDTEKTSNEETCKFP